MTDPSGGGPAAPSDADLIREQLTTLNLSQRDAARQLGIPDDQMTRNKSSDFSTDFCSSSNPDVWHFSRVIG